MSKNSNIICPILPELEEQATRGIAHITGVKLKGTQLVDCQTMRIYYEVGEKLDCVLYPLPTGKLYPSDFK